MSDFLSRSVPIGCGESGDKDDSISSEVVRGEICLTVTQAQSLHVDTVAWLEMILALRKRIDKDMY